MSNSRVRPGQIQVGKPMPFDAYDQHGRLLLRRGTTVASADQLDRLMDQGLFREVAEESKNALISNYMPSYSGTRVSVIGMLRDAVVGLQRLIAAPERSSDFSTAVLEVAAPVRRACKLDPDAAIGNIVATRGLPYPARHAVNCAALTELLLARLGADEAEIAGVVAGALTMNLTLVDLQQMLYERPAAPTEEQNALIQAHPEAAAARLQALGVDDPVWLATVAQHHEAFNGTGYPRQLAGHAIVRGAQVLLLVDQYCSLVSERAFRAGVNPATVMQKLRAKPPEMFAPEALEALRREVGVYPPGSVVQLVNHEVAMVTSRTQHPEHPIAQALINDTGRRHPEPRKRQTSKPAYAIAKAVLQNALNPFPSADELWHEAYDLGQ